MCLHFLAEALTRSSRLRICWETQRGTCDMQVALQICEHAMDGSNRNVSQDTDTWAATLWNSIICNAGQRDTKAAGLSGHRLEYIYVELPA